MIFDAELMGLGPELVKNADGGQQGKFVTAPQGAQAAQQRHSF